MTKPAASESAGFFRGREFGYAQWSRLQNVRGCRWHFVGSATIDLLA
jgi:hypothetical protein